MGCHTWLWLETEGACPGRHRVLDRVPERQPTTSVHGLSVCCESGKARCMVDTARVEVMETKAALQRELWPGQTVTFEPGNQRRRLLWPCGIGSVRRGGRQRWVSPGVPASSPVLGCWGRTRAAPLYWVGHPASCNTSSRRGLLTRGDPLDHSWSTLTEMSHGFWASAVAGTR